MTSDSYNRGAERIRDEFARALQDRIEETDRLRPIAENLYRALVNTGKRSAGRRLTYRCLNRRCMLLDAIETPMGILLHQPRHKYTEAVNQARSNEAGRKHNTLDGNRRWKERSYFIEFSALNGSLRSAGCDLSCDHVLAYMLTGAEFRKDWDAGHSEVRVRLDHSRYVV